jgi:hypothetical protein
MIKGLDFTEYSMEDILGSSDVRVTARQSDGSLRTVRLRLNPETQWFEPVDEPQAADESAPTA